MSGVELTVVIPIRNEAASIVELHRELTDVLTRWGRPYELIVVDDGSTDESFDGLARLQAVDPRLRIIRLRRNFGQTAAFAAGFDHARGRYIVTIGRRSSERSGRHPGDGRRARARRRHRLRLAKGPEGSVHLAAAAVDDRERV